MEHSILHFLRTSSGDGVCTGGLVDVWCQSVFNRNPYSQDPEDSIEETELRHLEGCSWRLDSSMGSVDGGQISTVAKVFDSVVSAWSKSDQWSWVGIKSRCGCGAIHGGVVPSGEALVPGTVFPPTPCRLFVERGSLKR